LSLNKAAVTVGRTICWHRSVYIKK